jgi:hypothetical protein
MPGGAEIGAIPRAIPLTEVGYSGLYAEWMGKAFQFVVVVAVSNQ